MPEVARSRAFRQGYALVGVSKTSYVQTRKDLSTWGPNELMTGISAASRPRATSCLSVES